MIGELQTMLIFMTDGRRVGEGEDLAPLSSTHAHLRYVAHNGVLLWGRGLLI